MGRIRIVFFAALTLSGIALAVILAYSGTNTPLGRTLAPLFTLLGKGAKTADRALSRVVPVDEIDEAMLGRALVTRFNGGTPHAADPYVNALVQELTTRKQKPFSYEAFVVPGEANAFALPGGVILVTEGLLKILSTESELASIVGHEVGHVELGHCFDAVRFEMMAKKAGADTLGEIADFAWAILVKTSFGKTQEDEADRYGFDALIESGYDPRGTADAFEHMNKAHAEASSSGINPFRDYFSSHPPMELRIENFRERAARWRQRNDQLVYLGRKNFVDRITKGQKQFANEMVR